ncbi:hypothetical protein [Nocardiopsis salina]|uniref:hypothetical protein n=1 Tax=Nocardiopsis salina TaxID=245836 RepID=UPI00034AC37F|nr:hypothetical protein [Nocardiopsis salina]
MPDNALEDEFFTDADPGSCYDDGFINPANILIPYIDADALEEYAGDIRRAGCDIGTADEDIVTSWGGLSGVYQAPESEALLEAVDPVETDGESVATGTSGLASALEDFAETVRHYKTRLSGLRDEAVEMRKVIDTDEDWRDDEDLVEEHNALLLRVQSAQGGWDNAQLDAANEITAPSRVRHGRRDGRGRPRRQPDPLRLQRDPRRSAHAPGRRGRGRRTLVRRRLARRSGHRDRCRPGLRRPHRHLARRHVGQSVLRSPGPGEPDRLHVGDPRGPGPAHRVLRPSEGRGRPVGRQ